MSLAQLRKLITAGIDGMPVHKALGLKSPASVIPCIRGDVPVGEADIVDDYEYEEGPAAKAQFGSTSVIMPSSLFGVGKSQHDHRHHRILESATRSARAKFHQKSKRAIPQGRTDVS